MKTTIAWLPALALAASTTAFAAGADLLCKSGNSEIRITHLDDAHASATIEGPAGALRLEGGYQLAQSSRLGSLYQYRLASPSGEGAEIWVSRHHLFNSPALCGRAGCPDPQPSPTTHPGPHRIAPLADQGISAEARLAGETMLLDCDEITE